MLICSSTRNGKRRVFRCASSMRIKEIDLADTQSEGKVK
jgi:hypothetical protein